ncbi:MAG: TVP38/TMEM64 family protein [Alphaproteobacteria bacterium]|nr:TVP38/TMEM64 family protein [Alphaproteobacteria bacterium]
MTRVKRFAPLAVLLAALIVAYAAGVQHQLSWAALAHHQAALHAAVAAHPVACAGGYVAVYIAAVALSLPGAAVLTVAGGLLFGIVAGAALAVTGATLGAVLLFLVARHALADLLSAKAGRLMARIRPGLERDGFSYLLALRLLPVFPFWLVNLAPALAGMRLAPFAAATLLGIVPGSVVFASIGAGVGDVLARGGTPDLALALSPRILLPLIGLAALSLAPVGWRHWRMRHA